MKLPHDATIAPEKLKQYLLAKRLEDDKSRFLALAGYTCEHPERLEQDLRELLVAGDAHPTRSSPYGVLFELRGCLRGPNGRTLNVVTIWMTERGTNQTKFITLYPDKG